MELQMLVQPRAEPWRRRSRRASQGLDGIHVCFEARERRRERVSQGRALIMGVFFFFFLEFFLFLGLTTGWSSSTRQM